MGLKRGGQRTIVRRGAVVLAAMLATPLITSAPADAQAAPSISVIVREVPGAGDAPERAVLGAGGTVGRHFALIDGFVATIPTTRLDVVRRAAGVVSVTPNSPVHLAGGFDGFEPKQDLGSMYHIAQEVTGAGEYWNYGLTGKGVGVALLDSGVAPVDSGVAPVDGLTAPGKVIHGPDLSLESQVAERQHLDTFGHGTHMAGIIAGRDDAAPAVVQKGTEGHFLGMAPDARVVSVKAADAHGATDVSQVLAGIDWIVQHKDDPELNIRVLNLSFGTDGTQDYRIDPLTYAVEVAWRHGIVVVVSAGNRGYGSAKLNNPAYDPFIIAVGASDSRDTYDVADDVLGDFSSFGDEERAPDLVAPGKSVVSLRAPDSAADLAYPAARVGTRQMRGSGTSQAAAVVSGAVALIVQQRPDITPDQVKALLRQTARNLPAADPRGQGAGLIDLKVARNTASPVAVQTWMPATGLGSLEASRGSDHLEAEGVVLDGEKDIFGAPFGATSWAAEALGGTAWAGGVWNGNRWSGDSWSGNRWSGNRWSGDSWSGHRWSGNRWSGNRWSASAWPG